MRKGIAVSVLFTLLAFAILQPNDAEADPVFQSAAGSSAIFDGQNENFLRVTNSAEIDMGSGDFTISWWQYTTSNQFLFPRILQFGSGHNYTDSWAISEENDGNIYVWINGLNISSIPIPAMLEWHHIALVRNGDTFRWFLNGDFVNSTNFTPVIPCDGCLSKDASFFTGNLDLLIGGGDDQVTGSFIGKIAGFQIAQSVIWPGTSSFATPTEFVNPDNRFVFSMYGNQTSLIDASINQASISNPGISVGDFEPFNNFPSPDPSPTPSESPSPDPSPTPSESPSPDPSPTPSESPSPDPSPTPSESPSPDPSPTPSESPSPDPSPTPSDSPLPQNGATISSDFFGWNSEFEFTADQVNSPFDFREIRSAAIGISLRYEEADGTAVRTICYIDAMPFWDSSQDGNFGTITLPDFSAFSQDIFPDPCQTPQDSNNPNGYQIPDYFARMFGPISMRAEFVLWGDLVEDLSNVNTATYRFAVDLEIPPEITSYQILHEGIIDSQTSNINFGDTFTVTMENQIHLSKVIAYFEIPEATMMGGVPSNNYWCPIELTFESDGASTTSIQIPTLQVLLDHCRSIFDGYWKYDSIDTHRLKVVFQDVAENDSFSPYLYLNPITDVNWDLYPTEAWIDYPTWATSVVIFKSLDAPIYDFAQIKRVSIGIPVAISNVDHSTSGAICHLDMTESFNLSDEGNDWAWGIYLELPSFFELTRLMFPHGCESNKTEDHPLGYTFPQYELGLFGETQTAFTIYLWDRQDVEDFSETETAFEAIPFSVSLPPEIESYDLPKYENSSTNHYYIQSGESITLHIRNLQNAERADLWIFMPEIYPEYEWPDLSDIYSLEALWCPVSLDPDSSGIFSNLYVVPSVSEIVYKCHEEFPHDWSFDSKVDHEAFLTFEDIEGNHSNLISFTLHGIPDSSNNQPQENPSPQPSIPPTQEVIAPMNSVQTQELFQQTNSTKVELKSDELVDEPKSDEISVKKTDDEKKLETKSVDDAKPENQGPLSIQEIPKTTQSQNIDKACKIQGILVYTKSGRLQICNSSKKIILDVKACAGKSATPTYPWIFRAYRFTTGYLTAKTGIKLYYPIFFFKGLSIAGVDKVSSKPCSQGSVFVEKVFAKRISEYARKYKPLIYVRNS